MSARCTRKSSEVEKRQECPVKALVRRSLRRGDGIVSPVGKRYFFKLRTLRVCETRVAAWDVHLFDFLEERGFHIVYDVLEELLDVFQFLDEQCLV